MYLVILFPAETLHDPSIIVRSAVTAIIDLMIGLLYAISSLPFSPFKVCSILVFRYFHDFVKLFSRLYKIVEL